MRGRLGLEAKKLFLEIHEEYQLQAPTLQNDNDYINDLLALQKRVLSDHEDVTELRAEFERLKGGDNSIFQD